MPAPTSEHLNYYESFTREVLAELKKHPDIENYDMYESYLKEVLRAVADVRAGRRKFDQDFTYRYWQGIGDIYQRLKQVQVQPSIEVPQERLPYVPGVAPSYTVTHDPGRRMPADIPVGVRPGPAPTLPGVPYTTRPSGGIVTPITRPSVIQPDEGTLTLTRPTTRFDPDKPLSASIGPITDDPESPGPGKDPVYMSSSEIWELVGQIGEKVAGGWSNYEKSKLHGRYMALQMQGQPLNVSKLDQQQAVTKAQSKAPWPWIIVGAVLVTGALVVAFAPRRSAQVIPAQPKLLPAP